MQGWGSGFGFGLAVSWRAVERARGALRWRGNGVDFVRGLQAGAHAEVELESTLSPAVDFGIVKRKALSRLGFSRGVS